MASKRKSRSPSDEHHGKLPMLRDLQLPGLHETIDPPSTTLTPGFGTASTPGSVTVSTLGPTIVPTPEPPIANWTHTPHLEVQKYDFGYVFDFSNFRVFLGRRLLEALNKTRPPERLELTSPLMYGSLTQACMQNMVHDSKEDIESKVLLAALRLIMATIILMKGVIDMYSNFLEERWLLYMANASHALIHRDSGIIGEKTGGKEWRKAHLQKIQIKEGPPNVYEATFLFLKAGSLIPATVTLFVEGLLKYVKPDPEMRAIALGLVSTTAAK